MGINFKKIKIKRIMALVLVLMLGFSLFNIGKVLASSETFSLENVNISDKSDGVVASITSFDNSSINSNIEFYNLNDYVVFDLKIKNNSNQDYTIESISDNNPNTYILYEYEKHQNEKFGANSILNLPIKISYNKEVTNMDKRNLHDSTSIRIKIIGEDGKKEEETIIINPVTGDNITIYIIIGLASIIGLAIIAVNKNKKVKKSLFVLLLMIPLLVKAASLNLDISFNNNIKLLDKLVVTYDIQGTTTTEIIPYNGSVSEPSAPSIDGYNFIGWYNGDELFDFNSSIKNDISITAKFDLINYTITYDYGNGSLPSGKTNPANYNVETETFTINNPVREGYSFSGWTGTNISTLQTEVTIYKGSIGDLSYKANYSPNEDTKYTVIHKYKDLEASTFTTEEVTLHGSSDTTVQAPLKPKTGFVTPEVKNVYIKPDGSGSETYEYLRETYSFNITDRTYVDQSSTPNGTYEYGKTISIKTEERPGYDFKWSDGDTNLERTFTLEEPMNLTPEYIADDNTPYTVNHYKMKTDGQTYEIAETQNLRGTTDSPISPAVNAYDGFTSPAVQSTTINGDGHTVVDYYYTRNQVTVTFTNTEYIEEDVTSGPRYYDEKITLTAKTRDGYTFTGWTNGKTSESIILTVGTSDISVGPEYTAKTNTPYVVNHYKMNLDGENYTKVEDDTQNLTGTTDATITPAVNTYDGFTSPSTQTTTISGKGDTVVNYYYTRNKYTLTINHPEYLEEDKSGEYYYEEEITLTAKDRQGYTFAGWNTGETTKTITVSMPVDGITEEATYTSNTDTTYSVTHKYKKLTEGYDEVTINGTGTTGDTIEAPLRP